LVRQIGGLHAGSAGYIYALTSAGQRLLDVPGARKRVSEPSLPFVDHTLAIADLFVGLHQQVANTNAGAVELLDVQTEPTCWRGWTGIGGSRELLRPDLYLEAVFGEDELRWFVEVDCGTEHRPAIVRKAGAYQRYYLSGAEQDRDGVFPRVAWVVPNDQRADQLSRSLASEPSLSPELFAVLLADDAARQLIR